MKPDPDALLVARTDVKVCRDRYELLKRAWLKCPTKAPRFENLYCRYCTAKEEWHAAEARLARIEGRPALRRIK